MLETAAFPHVTAKTGTVVHSHLLPPLDLIVIQDFSGIQRMLQFLPRYPRFDIRNPVLLRQRRLLVELVLHHDLSQLELGQLEIGLQGNYFLLMLNPQTPKLLYLLVRQFEFVGHGHNIARLRVCRDRRYHKRDGREYCCSFQFNSSISLIAHSGAAALATDVANKFLEPLFESLLEHHQFRLLADRQYGGDFFHEPIPLGEDGTGDVG